MIVPVELRTYLVTDDQNQPCGMWAIIRDTTERKRAEAALQESKEELQQVASSISDYLWSATVDQNGKVVYRYYSPVVEQITSRPPEFYMSGPDAWLSTVCPDDRLPVGQAAARITSSQSTYESAEYRIIRPDGTLRWVQDKTTVRQMGNGTLRLFGTVSDITERKRAEEVLQKAHDELERRVDERTAELVKANENLDIFRKFAEASGEGFGMSDFEGRIAYVNPTLCRMFGEGKPEDIIGKNVSAYYPAEYMQRRKTEVLPALLRNG